MTIHSKLNRWDDADELLRALGALRPEEFQAARADLVDLLGHDDSDVREEAVRTLGVRMRDVESHELVLNTLRADISAGVRAIAAFALAATSSEVTRRNDVHTLLAVLRNPDESSSVRAAAYEGLLILEKNAAFPTAGRDFDPAIDVDWDWINTLNP